MMRLGVIAALMAMFVVAGCGDSESSTDSTDTDAGQSASTNGGEAAEVDMTSVVGEWKIEKVDGVLEGANIGTKYTFTGDGEIRIGPFGKGKYSIEGSTMTVDLGVGTPMTIEYELTNDGKTLVYKITGDAPQTFTMARQP